MAYLPYKNQGGNQPQLAGASGAGSAPGGGMSTSNAPVTQNTNPGSGFTNLQQYFGLNGAGANSMATGLAQDQFGRENGAVQGMNSLYGGFLGAVNQGIANPTVGYGAGSQSNGNNTQTFTKTYSGPQSLYGYDPNEYQNVLGQFQTADQDRRLMQTPGGIGQLLSQKYGTGANQYSGGQQGLDSFFAGAGLNSPHLAHADPYQSGPLMDYFNSWNGAAQGMADQAPGQVVQPVAPTDRSGKQQTAAAPSMYNPLPTSTAKKKTGAAGAMT